MEEAVTRPDEGTTIQKRKQRKKVGDHDHNHGGDDGGDGDDGDDDDDGGDDGDDVVADLKKYYPHHQMFLCEVVPIQWLRSQQHWVLQICRYGLFGFLQKKAV